MAKIVEFTSVAKPFTSFPEGAYDFMVNLEEKEVSVWSEGEGFYTNLHSLSSQEQKRLLAEAQWQDCGIRGKVRGLLTSAGEAGDLECMALCRRALAGDLAAKVRVVEIINDAEAQN